MIIFQGGIVNPAEQGQETQRKKTFNSNPVAVQVEDKVQINAGKPQAVATYTKATNESIAGKTPRQIMESLIKNQDELSSVKSSLIKTLSSTRDVVVFKNTQEQLATINDRLDAIDQFFKICNITYEEQTSYRAYLEFQQSKQFGERIGQVKSVNKAADFAIKTTSKTTQAAGTKLEGDLAKLRDIIPRKMKLNPDLKPPTEFA